jgi:thiol:disulfide interchange protein
LFTLTSKSQDILSTSFFTGSFQELKEEAKRLKKPILLDFSASWCAPCQKMDRDTYSDEVVASLVSIKYFAFKVDVEQLEGMEIAEKYQVFQYPTLVFLDYNGKVMGRLKGFYPPDYFIRILEKNLKRKRKYINKEEEFNLMVSSL